MNIIFEKITDNYTLKLAEFNDDTETLFNIIKNNLSADEKKYCNTIKNNKRKREWIGTRILLKTILNTYNTINYDKNGNPYLKNGLNISITHTENIVGIIIGKNKDIGIDIEIISARILKTAHKFISEKELKQFTEEDKLKNIFIRWCSKETLFKIKGGGGYDFKTDFIIHPNNSTGEIYASVVKIQKEDFILLYRFLNYSGNKLLLVWYA